MKKKPKAKRVVGRRPTGAPRTPKKRPATRVKPTEAKAPKGSIWSDVLKTAQEEPRTDAGLVRLNAYLARCGVASRRGSDELISERRVTINGETITSLGVKVDPLRDTVAVDGEALKPEKPVYVLLHKPKGVVCTNSPREQKQRAIDLLIGVKGRVFPVGRLDADSEGLLILTNDGGFADRLMHPRYGVPKVYKATLRGRIDPKTTDKARGGVWLAEGRTGTARIAVKRRTKDRSFVEVTIREGRNREIRRVFAGLGFPVIKLERLRIGRLTLRGLGRGKWRFLTRGEVRDLLATAGENEAATL